MASTTNGIATILEACTIGGVTPPADLYRCVLLSELGTFGCVLIDEPSVEYAANQAVKYMDIKSVGPSMYSIIYHAVDSGFNDITDGPYADDSIVALRQNPFNNPPHEFKYWTRSGSLEPLYPSEGVHIEGENIHLYANWLHYYYVTFDVNGKGTAPSQQLIAEGGKVAQPTDPSYSGYKFLGWYKDNEVFVEPWVFANDTMPAGGITLYALWVEGTYTLTVTSYPNSNYGTATGSGAYSSGATATMTATPKPGCKFVQWSDASTANPKTVTMNQNRSYSANFIMEPTDDIRIVDNELKLYDYFEWQSIVTKPTPPTPIGVAIIDNATGQDEWLVWYKTYIGDTNVANVVDYASGGSSYGTVPATYIGNISTQNFPAGVRGNYYDLLYPHSGRDHSDLWKAATSRDSKAACVKASALRDGGLYWYVFNVYEANQLYSKILDKTVDGNTVRGIDSYFAAAGLGKVIRHHTGQQVSGWPNTRNHLTVDAPLGNDSYVYRMAMESDPPGGGKTANSIGFWTAGNYGDIWDANWVRPVARFVTNGEVKATFDKNGGTGVAPDEITKFYNDCILLPDRGTLSSNFRGWDTDPSATTPTYQPGDPVFLTADTVFYAIY